VVYHDPLENKFWEDITTRPSLPSASVYVVTLQELNGKGKVVPAFN